MFFRSSKTPRYTYVVKVEYPTVIQLEHPKPLPLKVYLIPDLDGVKTTIRSSSSQSCQYGTEPKGGPPKPVDLPIMEPALQQIQSGPVFSSQASSGTALTTSRLTPAMNTWAAPEETEVIF
ncbi:uncharacterized protein Z519_09069 [Cladophialophora bantiana CBS 173.52]|uniref:Uncharacterized protein n=1 Tax=Cladophialophora bantiana (strain ATCC 10958 / CBS 173.52 / CDC B-1940 / NIH 8579) TaxID=1442370 RepID=A0A0D2I0P5_CLAB1|nr:uncharacterized protein Z519_09069 [Cladophialophora bantiana CBS 173.52]KIW90424.1 hypothetical protein Z519_09069 [Cladophialophora bantiana CBS 173.52]